MTTRKSRGAKSRIPVVPPTRREKPQAAARRHYPSPAAVRETIESVVIAFALAFLFRTFEAEAFVIPTGSMAPTLMGRHKDLVCPQCGCPYQIGASSEVHPDGTPRINGDEPARIAAGTCPMCRYTDQWRPHDKKYRSYNGDRILVGKLIYQFRDPQRWEVIVFKFPGDPPTVPLYKRGDSQTNFIKRLIGLPDETVRIQNGDIWTRRGDEDEEDFHIERKPPEKLLAMLQPVFDNKYMPRIADLGWPPRWAEPTDGGRGAWSCDDYVSFRTDGSAAGENWLRYEHRVPSHRQWRDLIDGRGVAAEEVKPRWITDFMAYDTNREADADPAPPPDGLGSHWVGDLALCCTVDVQGEAGELVFELRKGGRRFQCRIDVSTGRATLSIGAIGGAEMAQFRPSASTDVRGPGRHEIRFANCDNQMLLWVDQRLVSFDSTTAYEQLDNTRPQQSDKAPVGVASLCAAVEVSRLRVLRDIYYIAVEGDASNNPMQHDVLYLLGRDGLEHKMEPIEQRRYVEFPLGADQFFVLGDNSARSKDGRLWGEGNNCVDRELLIGKALFIYWPHSWDRIPYIGVPCPYFPNFKDMGLVR